MNYRRLGRTGLEVSEVGFGAWGIGKDAWIGAEDDESLRALNSAIDLGLNFIDTALAYGDGHSERLVGRVVGAREETVHVATKIPPRNRVWPAPLSWISARSPVGVICSPSRIARPSPRVVKWPYW